MLPSSGELLKINLQAPLQRTDSCPFLSPCNASKFNPFKRKRSSIRRAAFM